jgi:prepilin-type N-terminal cleavage/methylation domain-containing protein
MAGKEIFSILQKKLATFRSSFRFQNNQANAQAGFTLVELLTVISIMALISSIMIANVAEARRSAEDARSLSNIRSIITALQAFYLDHGYWPTLSHDPNDTYYSGSPANKLNNCTPKSGSDDLVCSFSVNYGASGSYADFTTCTGNKACSCTNYSTETRRKTGWFPFLDGSFNRQDAYFTPESTPHNEAEITCTIPFSFPYLTRYDSTFLSDGNSSFTLNYILKRPRPTNFGIFNGCNAIGCLYIIRGDTKGTIK